MKALVLEGKEKFVYKEVEMPKCPDDGVLLKVDSVGLCGSDVRTYFHGHHNVKYPCILGHENAGTIVEVGSKVTGLEKNDRIIVNPVIPCGKCYYCKDGRQNLCSHQLNYGHHLQGGFAEYMVIPGIGLERGQVIKIPDNITTDEIVVVELLSSVINSQEYANVTLGETVVIFGAGPIGCLHAQVAHLRGAKRIIMIDINDTRLELASKFYVTDSINSQKVNIKDEIMNLTEGFGADVVISATPVVETQAQGLDLLRKRGRLVLFGGVSKDNPLTTFDSNKIHYDELAIMGSFGFGPNNFKKAFDLVVNKMIKVDGFITHVLPLKDAVKGIREIKAGNAIKVVLKPGIY